MIDKKKVFNSDDVIDLRSSDEKEESFSDEPEFKIESFEEHDKGYVNNAVVASVREESHPTKEVSDKIKVRFDKFVNLVATHVYEEIFDKYKDEDIIVSTNLLTDLANSHEEKENKKNPLFLFVGILIGAAIMWIIFRT
ncbi:MAG: hypothetical protein WC806_02310 [Candidatus Gracilibacteria bacterium]|jgi:hypothetical protein